MSMSFESEPVSPSPEDEHPLPKPTIDVIAGNPHLQSANEGPAVMNVSLERKYTYGPVDVVLGIGKASMIGSTRVL